MEQPKKFSVLAKLTFCFAAWVGAWVLACNANPLGLMYAWTFPSGFERFVMRRHWIQKAPEDWLIYILIWALYAYLTVALMRSQTRLRYWQFYSTLCVLLIINANGCRGPSQTHTAAVFKDGIARLTPANQINTRYAQVDNFIQHFGAGGSEEQWQTHAYLEGRFEIVFVENINVDYSKWTVTKSGEPTFYLHVAEKIDFDPMGAARGCSFDTELGKKFGQAEWDKFVASGYDLKTLGIPQSEIHPIDHWDEYVHVVLRERIPSY